MNRIGCGRGIGGALRHTLQGESFIRHIGNDKLIYDFKEGIGTTVHDKSHCGNDGTFGAGAAAPTWKRNSLYFDGGDYVDLTGINHGISTGGFTFCCSMSNFSAGSILYDQEQTRFPIYNHPDRITIDAGATIIITDTGISSISPIIFQITRNLSGGIECFINGKSSDKGITFTTNITYNGISKMVLGARYSQDSLFLTSTMYFFRILNKGLSEIECQNEYLANKFRGNN